MDNKDYLEHNIDRLINSTEPQVKMPDTRKQQILSKLIADEEVKQASTSVWKMIIRSQITKYATAAILMIAISMSLVIIEKTTTPAYAIDQTIEAYSSIRWLYACQTRVVSKKTRTRECWLECDEQGNMARMRFQADNVGEPIGPLTITGNSESSEAWLPMHNFKLTGYGDPSIWLGFDLSELYPKLLIEDLLEQQRRNEIIVDIDESFWNSKPIKVTVMYPNWALSENWKKVFYIDQNTKLIKKIEKFEKQDGRYRHKKTIAFSKYNHPIDGMVFSLDNDVSVEAQVFDMTGIQPGLPQGDMADNKIATEVTTQFLEALVDKDLSKAGRLYLAAPEVLVEHALKGANVLKIISVEQAVPDTDPDTNAMVTSCKVLVERQGQYYEVNVSKLYVLKDKHRDYWYLCGCGPMTICTTDLGAVTLSTDDVDLNSVTYNGLVPGEFMKDWLVLGPLPYPVQDDIWFASKKGHRVAFETDSIDLVNFTPEVTFDNGDHEMSREWSILESTSNIIDLRQLDINKNDFQIAYVWAQVDMPEETKGALCVGSSDGVKIWLNGELVHANWLYRGIMPDSDRIPVNFKKGNNQVVLKIQNVLGDWGFCCRLLDE